MAAELQAAEIMLGHMLYIREVIKDVWDLTAEVRAETDAQDALAMINIRRRVLPSDRTLTLNIYVLRQMVDNDGATIVKIDEKLNVADDLTKPTPGVRVRGVFAKEEQR